MFEKFMLEVQNNAELGSELREMFEDDTITDKTQALIDLGKKHGYEYTKYDMKDFAEKLNADDTELSEDDLDSVAGGSKEGAKQFFKDFGDGFKAGFVSMATSLGLCFAD